MELAGKVVEILDPVTGTAKNGKDWTRQDFVIEYKSGEFTKFAAFTGFGKAVEHIGALQIDDQVTVQFNIESRESNGKWYTSLSLWKVVIMSKQSNDLPF